MDDSVKEASPNGTSDENGTGNGHALADVPALPADSIRPARDSFDLSRPVSAPVSPVDEDWTLSEIGTSASDAAQVPGENEPVEAGTGTGWPAEASAARPSGLPEASTVFCGRVRVGSARARVYLALVLGPELPALERRDEDPA